MAFLRQWLLGVVSCAFLVSLLDQLTPEGSVRKLARFSGGLVLILCMLRPLGTAEPWELALDLDGFSADRVALEEQYRDVSGQSLAAVIAAKVNCFTVKGSLFRNTGRADTIRNFRLYRVWFCQLCTANENRQGCSGTKCQHDT